MTSSDAKKTELQWDSTS